MENYIYSRDMPGGTASVTEADFTINWTETSTGTTGTRPAMVTLTAEPQAAPDTRERSENRK